MRLTTAGIVFTLAGITLCVAAYRFSLPGLLPAGILLLGLVLLSVVLAFFSGARLAAVLDARTRRVDGVPVAEVGAPLDLRAALTNRTPLSLGAFEVEFVPREGFGETRGLRIPGMDPGGTITIDADFAPDRRGMSGLQAVKSVIDGPFGLCSVTKTVHREFPVAVSTPIQRVGLPVSAGIARPMSDSPQVVRGDTSRDFHTREYVPGDDLRHIHWASTARVGELMVRQEAEEETPFAAVVLDTAGLTAGDHPTEVLISGAASLTTAYLRAGYDVLFYSGGRREVLSGRRGEDRLRLVSARYAAGGTELPGELGRLGSVVAAIVCAPSPARADEIAGHLPRKTSVRRLTADEVEVAEGLDAELFGHRLALPESWTRRTRRSRR